MGKKSKKTDLVEEPELEESQAQQDNESVKLTYEEQVELALPIAQPMASRKLAKKAFKVIKKGYANKKAHVGVKTMQKLIKKGTKGIVLLAGDTDPMDVITHFPILCEEKNIPYIWVPSRFGLGQALSKGSAIGAFVESGPEYKDLYDEVYKSVKDTPLPV